MDDVRVARSRDVGLPDYTLEQGKCLLWPQRPHGGSLHVLIRSEIKESEHCIAILAAESR